jgi:hypothetical protein
MIFVHPLIRGLMKSRIILLSLAIFVIDAPPAPRRRNGPGFDDQVKNLQKSG